MSTRRGRRAVGFGAVVLVLGGVAAARAATITVCQVGCSYQLIQPALAAANGGDVILVSDGAYFGTLNFGSKSVAIRSVNGPYATRIDGNGAGPVVVFDGAGPGAVLEGFTVTGGGVNGNGGGMVVTNSSPTITNCVITGNTATGLGGGMYVSGNSSPNVAGCIIARNQAASGGGMYLDTSTGTFTGCTLSLNTATNGSGGGAHLNAASPSFTSCTVSANVASEAGGGICSINSAPRLVSCRLSGNEGRNGGGFFGQGMSSGSGGSFTRCVVFNNTTPGGGHDGGGIALIGTATSMSDCTVSGNRGFSGGGMVLVNSTADLVRTAVRDNYGVQGGGFYVGATSALIARQSSVTGNLTASGGGGAALWGTSTLTFTDVLVAGNRALNPGPVGGGIVVVGGTATFTHCTMAGNHAEAGGGGLQVNGGTALFRNGIIWGNSGSGAGAAGGTLTITGSDVQGGAPGSGNFALNPRFLLPVAETLAPTSAGDYRIQSSSPCIDKVAAGLTPIDLEGDPRPQGAKADSGADEAGRLANGYLEGTAKLPAGWTGTGLGAADRRVATPVRDGKSAFQFVAGAANKRLQQTRSVSGKAGKVLTVRGWSKAQGVTGTGAFGVELRITHTDGTTRAVFLPFTRGTHDWVKAQKSVRAAKAFRSVQLALHFDRQRGKAWFDGVELLVK